MTNPLRSIFMSLAGLAIIALLVISLPASLAAQKGARPPAKPEISKFYLAFLVTIRGSGSSESDLISETWSVDRTYESTFILLDKGGPFLTMNMTDSELKNEMLSGGNVYTRLNSSAETVTVSINDSYMSVTTEVCPIPGGSYKETTSIVRTWKGADKAPSLPGRTGITKRFELPLAFYNVHIPVFVGTKTAPMIFTEHIAVTRKPTKKTIEKLPLGSVQVPIVEGILDYPAISHTVYQPLDVSESTVLFKSGPIKPSEPVLKGVPDSIDVTVEISYRFTTDIVQTLKRLVH